MAHRRHGAVFAPPNTVLGAPIRDWSSPLDSSYPIRQIGIRKIACLAERFNPIVPSFMDLRILAFMTYLDLSDILADETRPASKQQLIAGWNRFRDGWPDA